MSVFIEDGVVAYINANIPESYVAGSDVMNDLSGTSVTFGSSPGVTTLLNDGGLDFSAGNNYLRVSESISAQTISLWYKKTESVISNPVYIGNGIYIRQGFPAYGVGSFFSDGKVYVDGIETDYTTWHDLPDGVLNNVVFVGSYVAQSQLTLFANDNDNANFKAIVHSALIYDRELTDEEILYNYNTGISNPVALLGTIEISVDWVFSNGSYEVSSKNHLLQLMHSGSLFPNTGTPPSNYMNSSYIQTADIDLESDISNIKPIGTFTGTYDGQGFRVSNWSCTAVSGKGTGLFGFTSSAEIKNLVLDGIWYTVDTNDGCFFSAHNSSSQFYNITTDFAPGTTLTATSNSLGAMFSYTGSCTIQNITLAGTIDTFSGQSYTGGITGYSSSTNYSYVRNIATFTNGLIGTGYSTGGMWGASNSDTLTHIMNTMHGDVTANIFGGGIFGILNSGTTEFIYQGMVGNISGSTSAGIASYVSGSGTITNILNYMTGDVQNGLMGNVSSRSISKSIVAMNGNTTNATVSSTTASVEILVDDSYGLTYSSNAYGLTEMDTSTFETNSEYDLPFFSFSFTDNASNQLDWDFVYGSVTEIPQISIVSRPISLNVTFQGVSGAVAYMMTIQTFGQSDTRTIDEGFTDLFKRIDSLTPDTEYTVGIYTTTDGTEYTLHLETQVTTTPNLSENYDVSEYLNQNGTYDLSNISQYSGQYINQFFDELFSTGDSVSVTLSDDSNLTTRFINRGGSVSIDGSDAFFLPFEASAGSSQSVSMTLSDNTQMTITFDETNDTIEVDGVVYSHGQSIIVDGKRLVLENI